MAEEMLSMQSDNRTIEFLLYWYEKHSSLTIQDYDSTSNDSMGVNAKMMFRAPPEVLRTIADQFYEWAETLESELAPLPSLPALPKVTGFEKTRHGAPVRWEGMVDNGMHLEIEYRGNLLECRVGNDEVFFQKVDSENPLYMEEHEMFKFLAGVLDFSDYAAQYPAPTLSSEDSK